MSRHETIIQYCKTILLLAILCFAVWNVSSNPHSVNAQLAASSGFNYSHIATNTNTLVKSAGGTLHNVTVNTTAAGAITIFDASAANCTGGTTIAILPSSVAVGNYNYDLQFTNGLCVTTAAASDITVTSR
jgi:hypothetical protein